jgi:hypothetical protein
MMIFRKVKPRFLPYKFLIRLLQNVFYSEPDKAFEIDVAQVYALLIPNRIYEGSSDRRPEAYLKIPKFF